MRITLLTLILAAGISSSRATVFTSDGSDTSVQAINNSPNCHDGDTITLPAGTFTWTKGIKLTKGIMVAGQTTITGAGTANCTSDDKTVVIDEKSPRGPGKLFTATRPTGKSFRLTGITFRKGTVTAIGGDGAIQLGSRGFVNNARIDNCRFDHLFWNAAIQLDGWVTGVEDHNLIECNSQGLSHVIFHDKWGEAHDKWGGATAGNGSWADFPYFGSEKFWFIETNTIIGTGNDISGTIDSFKGGRWVVRHNYMQNCAPGGHGTEGGGVRGERCQLIYDNTFNWTRAHGSHAHRSGSVIWHDNTFLGVNSQNGAHTALPYFRQLGAVGNDLSKWGLADGENGWDLNDAHGLYFNGTSASSTSISGSSARFTTDIPMVPHAYKGMQVRNDHVGSGPRNPPSNTLLPSSAKRQIPRSEPRAFPLIGHRQPNHRPHFNTHGLATRQSQHCYLHSAYIIDNDATTITYYYYNSGDRGAPLVFNSGDEFSVRRVLVALDQAGRGKGDLITARGPRHWPNQQQEPCFSWNNKNADTGQALGFHSSIPTQHEGSDYVNLGAGLPVNQIPAPVTAAYPASVNGGSAYDHEFTYPHPLVSGETPSPTPSSIPTATATATATPTPTAP